MTGVDVNERAVLLANENAASLGLADRFTACLPDAVPPEATYDEIWSNPPIRIGKAGPARAAARAGSPGWRPAAGR